MRKIKIPDNLTALTYRHLKDYILEGRLREGERLTEEFISKQLGISKSPVREALNRLETEGLIRIEPRRGAYVRTFSPSEAADLYDLREALETHSIGTAKLNAEALGDLRESVRRLQEYRLANDKLRYIDEDVWFHARIAAATGNLRLAQALETLQNQLRLLRLKTYDLSSSEAVHAHTGIVQALESQRREEARRLMQEHIRGTCLKLLRHMEERDSGARLESSRLNSEQLPAGVAGNFRA